LEDDISENVRDVHQALVVSCETPFTFCPHAIRSEIERFPSGAPLVKRGGRLRSSRESPAAEQGAIGMSHTSAKFRLAESTLDAVFSTHHGFAAEVARIPKVQQKDL
jgi:hypothetical protein